MLPVVIPVNRLARAKGRLERLLTPSERHDLALATLDTVVAAALGAGLKPLVLTADPAVAAHLGTSASILEESPLVSGLNAQLEAAIAGRPEVLILHADLPLATAEALRAFVAAAPAAPSATVVRSGDGGTNAMLLRPAGAFALAYGAGSHAKHIAAAREAGLEVVTVASPALELDLDTPTDVETFMATPGWDETRAGPVLARRR